MTPREQLADDWGKAPCDYKARMSLFVKELGLPVHESEVYSKMAWLTLPETLKDSIESWYVRAAQADKDQKGKKRRKGDRS